MTDLKDTRARLTAQRNIVGADSEAGRHISNLIEQFTNYGREKDEDARERLRGFIAKSMQRLSDKASLKPER